MDRTIEVNGKTYTEQEVREAIQNFKDTWETVAEIITNVVNELRETLQSIIDGINKGKHKYRKHTYHHVPMKVVPKTPNIDIPNVKIPKIRNNI